ADVGDGGSVRRERGKVDQLVTESVDDELQVGAVGVHDVDVRGVAVRRVGVAANECDLRAVGADRRVGVVRIRVELYRGFPGAGQPDTGDVRLREHDRVVGRYVVPEVVVGRLEVGGRLNAVVMDIGACFDD